MSGTTRQPERGWRSWTRREAARKDRIDAYIPASEAGVVAAAIEFYTGTSATFGPIEPGCVRRVQAPGYWAGPCN